MQEVTGLIIFWHVACQEEAEECKTLQHETQDPRSCQHPNSCLIKRVD